MSKNLEPKCKQCRRIGEKLMLKGDRCQTPKCAMVKRNYPPGVHGPKGKKRLSGYGAQLQEKQKAKKIYNLLEKQFKLTFEKAKLQKGDVGENFLKLLELRFDNVIYRLGLSKSRGAARALINHGHFTINKRKVNIPSYILKKGDLVAVKKSSQNSKAFANYKEVIKKSEVPGWINFDFQEAHGKILHAPSINDIKTTVDIHNIVEFYSR